MRVFYTPRYYADIGDGHFFPIRKFELVRDKLLGEGTLQLEDLIEPEPASVEDVRLVHTEDYISRLRRHLKKQRVKTARLAVVGITVRFQPSQ